MSIPEIRNAESDRLPSDASRARVSADCSIRQGAGLDIQSILYPPLRLPGVRSPESRSISGGISSRNRIQASLLPYFSATYCLVSGLHVDQPRSSGVDQVIGGGTSIWVGCVRAPRQKCGAFSSLPTTPSAISLSTHHIRYYDRNRLTAPSSQIYDNCITEKGGGPV